MLEIKVRLTEIKISQNSDNFLTSIVFYWKGLDQGWDIRSSMVFLYKVATFEKSRNREAFLFASRIFRQNREALIYKTLKFQKNPCQNNALCSGKFISWLKVLLSTVSYDRIFWDILESAMVTVTFLHSNLELFEFYMILAQIPLQI